MIITRGYGPGGSSPISFKHKNLRTCCINYNNENYYLKIAINDLDDINEILNAWSLDKFGVLLDLPTALILNVNVSEVYEIG